MRWVGLLAIATGCGFTPSAGSDASAIDGKTLGSDAAAMPRSCNEIHLKDPTLLSSSYTIDPDGPGGDDPIIVRCDMSTDNGGWTLVFLTDSSNLTGTPIPYTSFTPRLLADAQSALLAYRMSTEAVTGSYATFPFPDPWRTAAPFNTAAAESNVQVSVDGQAPMQTLLRYGYQSFVSVCNDAWVSTSNLGRICIVGTTAPFFAGWAGNSSDACDISTNSAGTMPCTPDRRFSIAVR